MLSRGEFPETRPSLLDALREPGEESHWGEFFRRYAPAVYRVARLRGVNEHDAEDIVQQVMIESTRHIKRFEYRPGRSLFRNWMRTITENKIVDRHRRRRPEVQCDAALESCPDTASTVEALWEQEWKLQDLLWCLEQLAADISPRRMEAFKMYSLEGRPAHEVAERLGMSKGYVYVTRCQILNLIRERLRELEERETSGPFPRPG